MIGHTRYGHGPEKVLVLPGNPGDHGNFEPAMPAVDLEAFEWLIPEYRGTGLSRGQAGQFTLAEILADLDELIRSLGWTRFHVAGHSYGGFIAQRLAVEWRSRVRSLVLVAPVLADGRPVDATMHALLRRACREDDSLRALADAVVGDRLPVAWSRWLVDYSRRLWNAEAAEAYFQLLATDTFADELAGNDVSCLVLVGEMDNVYTAALMRETLLRWLPNARLQIVPDCGHFIMLERPLMFAATLERHFRSLRPGGSR